MAKYLRPKVVIPNVYKTPKKTSGYRVRFRDDRSDGGWSTAYMTQPEYNEYVQAGKLTVKQQPGGRYKFDEIIADADVRFHIRVNDAGKQYHLEDVTVKEFKELYNTSRKLIKQDHQTEKKEEVNNGRPIPEIGDQPSVSDNQLSLPWD